MIELKIEDKYELQALHKALMEAKFHPEPKQPIIQQSPMVARVMNQVVDQLEKINWVTEAERRFKGIEYKNDWSEWRSNPSESIVVPCLAKHIEAIDKLALQPNDGGQKLLDILLAPYKVTNEKGQELLSLARTQKI